MFRNSPAVDLLAKRRAGSICLLSRYFGFVACFHLLNEDFSRLEAGDKMLVDYHGRIFGNVTGHFLCTLLVDEAAKPANVNILTFGQRILDHREERLQGMRYICFFDPGFIGNLSDYVCFRHDLLNFSDYLYVNFLALKKEYKGKAFRLIMKLLASLIPFQR